MTSLIRCAEITSLAVVLTSFPTGSFCQDQGLIAQWSFNETSGALARDSVSGVEDKIEGLCSYVQSVSGSGLRFDGYTTSVVRKGANAPKLGLP